MSEDKIKPEIAALAERGNITREECENLRCNSWEWEAIFPRLDDEAVAWFAELYLKNCQHDTRRPWRSYNEAVMGMVAPELVKRLKARIDAPVREDEDSIDELVAVTTDADLRAERDAVYIPRMFDVADLRGVIERHTRRILARILAPGRGNTSKRANEG